jgi:hypothetical protein
MVYVYVNVAFLYLFRLCQMRALDPKCGSLKEQKSPRTPLIVVNLKL